MVNFLRGILSVKSHVTRFICYNYSRDMSCCIITNDECRKLNYVKMRNNIKSRPFFIVEWALSFGLLQLGGRDGGAVLVVNMTKIRQFFTQNTVMSLTMCCCHWSDLRPIFRVLSWFFWDNFLCSYVHHVEID